MLDYKIEKAEKADAAKYCVFNTPHIKAKLRFITIIRFCL